MTLNQSRDQILQLCNELNRACARSREDWNDEVRAQFDREYIQELHSDIPMFLQSLEDLSRIIQQAKDSIK